jgi:hypothetical protein
MASSTTTAATATNAAAADITPSSRSTTDHNLRNFKTYSMVTL